MDGQPRLPLCRNADPEVWFPRPRWAGELREKYEERVKVPMAICRACLVREDCLQLARGLKVHTGIWGGVDFHIPNRTHPKRRQSA